jgi:hypothetical protein
LPPSAVADLVLVRSMPRGASILFPKRVHRISFVVRFVVCSVLTQVLYEQMPPSPSTLSAPATIVWWLAGIFLAIYSVFFVFLPRLRDAGMSEWWLLVALFPVINLLLALVLAFRAPRNGSHRADDPDFFWT